MTPATSIPSQHQIRAELEAMVLGDLLGPAGGEGEEITERTVRDRYLVGVLAPSRSAGAVAKPAVEEEEDEEIPLIPDELSEGGSDTRDDGVTDADIPVALAHLPSSFGPVDPEWAVESSVKIDGVGNDVWNRASNDQANRNSVSIRARSELLAPLSIVTH
jgi:hypothetical protein